MTSTPHFLCLQCRIPGKTYYLYIGRGAQYQGFDYNEKKAPAQLRVQDKFLQFARHYWRGLKIISCEVSSKDRVLIFKGIKENTLQEIYFFWRGRDLFFSHVKYLDSEIEVFRSWEGKVKELWDENMTLELENLFDDLGYGEVDFGDKDNDLDISDYLVSDEEGEEEGRPAKGYQKRMKTLNKMKGELVLLNGVDNLKKYTEIDLGDYKEVGEGRFRVNFKGLEGHFKKREYLFDKIKSWTKSRRMLQERIKKIENVEAEARVQKKSLGDQKIVQPIWKHEKTKSAVTAESKYIKLNFRGVTCYLGRTATENDYIRKQFAKKEDIWIHLEGYKSGHMIVKSDNFTAGPEELTILSSALVELNGIEIQDLPIIFTQVKNLKGVKGTPGMVTYKKEKHLRLIFDKDWRQKLTVIDT